MAIITYMKHKNTGKRRKTPMGFSWVTLFFGSAIPFIRWHWAGIAWMLGWLVLALIAAIVIGTALVLGIKLLIPDVIAMLGSKSVVTFKNLTITSSQTMGEKEAEELAAQTIQTFRDTAAVIWGLAIVFVTSVIFFLIVGRIFVSCYYNRRYARSLVRKGFLPDTNRDQAVLAGYGIRLNSVETEREKNEMKEEL